MWLILSSTVVCGSGARRGNLNSGRDLAIKETIGDMISNGFPYGRIPPTVKVAAPWLTLLLPIIMVDGEGWKSRLLVVISWRCVVQDASLHHRISYVLDTSSLCKSLVNH